MRKFFRFAPFLLAFFTTISNAHASPSPADKIPLDLYVMSLCPFGVQAEKAILPAVQRMAPFVDFKLHFIADENPVSPSTPQAIGFKSLHGPAEVEEDLRQVCVRKYSPSRLMDYILERNKNVKDPDWRPAAKKATLNVDEIQVCASGAEGTRLLAEDIQAVKVRKAQGSPTIDLDGKDYSGNRSERDVALAVCDALKGRGQPLPKACQDAAAMKTEVASTIPDASCGAQQVRPTTTKKPAPIVFDIQVVVDGRCKVCGIPLIDTLKQWHPGARIKTVEAGSKKGKALIALYKVRGLPFYVLDQTVEKDPEAKIVVDSYYSKVGNKYVILAGSMTYAQNIHLDRTLKPHQLDLFIQPLSPFTVDAEGGFLDFLAKSKSKNLAFSLHFLGPVDEDGLEAQQIRQEDLRQACLFQHAPAETFFRYLGCRNAKQDDSAQADVCLQITPELSQCMVGPEGQALLQDDSRLARELHIQSGPAVVWENHYGPFGLSDVDLKTLVAQSGT